MALNQDWKRILKKAWSIRLIILAGLFSGLEVAYPLVEAFIPAAHRGLFAAVAFVATAGAFVTRLLAQANIPQKANHD